MLYEDFYEEERERYVERTVEERCRTALEESGLATHERVSRRERLSYPGGAIQSWLCSFGPNPFSRAHTAICVREV